MSEDDIPSPNADSNEVWNPPNSFEIPAELVDAWSQLPPNHRFVPELPRVSWDALYSAIDQLNFGIVALSRVVTLGSTQPLEALTALKEMGDRSIAAQNSLRHFQAMMMAEALKAKVDE